MCCRRIRQLLMAPELLSTWINAGNTRFRNKNGPPARQCLALTGRFLDLGDGFLVQHSLPNFSLNRFTTARKPGVRRSRARPAISGGISR